MKLRLVIRVFFTLLLIAPAVGCDYDPDGDFFYTNLFGCWEARLNTRGGCSCHKLTKIDAQGNTEWVEVDTIPVPIPLEEEPKVVEEPRKPDWHDAGSGFDRADGVGRTPGAGINSRDMTPISDSSPSSSDSSSGNDHHWHDG